MTAHRRRRARSVERSLLEVEALRARLRRGQPARRRDAAALLERARRRHRHAVRARRCGCRVVPEIFGFDPRLQFVHEDDVVGALMFVIDATTCPASTTSPATASCRGARCARSSASGASRCRRCSPAWRPSRCGCFGLSTCRPRRSTLLRYGRGDRQPPLQAGRVPLPVHVRRHGRGVRARRCGSRSTVGDTNPTYRYERDVEDFFRHSPAVVRDRTERLR